MSAPATPGLRAAARVMERCDLLATYSEEEGRLTRRYGTPALRAAQDEVARWMSEAGMVVRRDSIGNLIGRYDGRAAGARALVLGSHLDTVRDAGRYDGPLGVLVALACVEGLREQGRRLPFAVEVVAFADEEGLRYHTTYLGSEVMAGALDPAVLARRDAEGISLEQAIRAFGGDPTALGSGRVAPEALLGYCEVHIEQGPVLEARGLPVGVVSAIAGQTRAALRLTGQAGHAGTVPMDLRRDALVAAAEVVLAVEDLARHAPGLVATVGQLAVEPGASNVIPGVVSLSLDVRHQEDGARESACDRLRNQAARICAARNVALRWDTVQQTAAAPCDAALGDLLAAAVARSGYPCPRLPSGAGHDAVIMRLLTPVAMLFVRCAGGISHHPAEAVDAHDVAVALQVMNGFLDALASDDQA